MNGAVSKELSEELIEEDHSIAPFLTENFDAVKFAAKEIKESSEACADGVATALDNLASSVATLERRLHSQITARHDDLLAQASGVEKLEVILDSIKSRIHTLKTALERVQNRITEPYNKVDHRTSQLARLQQACDYVRRIIRLIYLSKQLRIQVDTIEKHTDFHNPPNYLTKAAQNLADLAHVEQNVDLDGIEVIQDDRKFIIEARVKVRNYTEKLLDQAIITTNPSNIAMALLVFFFLGELDGAVSSALNKVMNYHKKEVQNLLALSNLEATYRKNRANLRNNENSTSFHLPGRSANKPTGIQLRNVLWKNFDLVKEKTANTIDQIVTLHRVLLRKRNSVTHELYIENCSTKSLSVLIWKSTMVHIQEALLLVCKKSNDCKMYLEGEYPRLYQQLLDLWERSSKDRDSQLAFNFTTKGQNQGAGQKGQQGQQGHHLGQGDPDDFESEFITQKLYNGMDEIKILFNSFETAYLGRSLSRMFDSVENIFTSDDRKSKWNISENDLEKLVEILISELEVSAVDLKLALAVSKNIVKTIKKISINAENSMTTSGKEAVQVIGPPTSEQIENCCIINTIWRFYWKCDLHFNDLKRGRYSASASMHGVHSGQTQFHTGQTHNPTNEMSEALSILANHSNSWLPSVTTALEEMMELVNMAITPLLSEIAKNIEKIILTMHDNSGTNITANTETCHWSKELKDFVSRVIREHFTTLVCKQAIMERLRGLSRRAVVQATSNVFLVRSGPGQKSDENALRSNLVKGLNELENALAPLITSPGGLITVADCGDLLRNTKPLLLSSPENILKNINQLGEDNSEDKVQAADQTKEVQDNDLSKQISDWNNYMLAIWQRSDESLFTYSPVGNKGYIAKTHRLTNSHKNNIIEFYHKFMLSENRTESEILTMHKVGLENYESGFKGDSFDDVYEILCEGVKCLAKIIEKSSSS